MRERQHYQRYHGRQQGERTVRTSSTSGAATAITTSPVASAGT
jgi:hypothetical protein